MIKAGRPAAVCIATMVLLVFLDVYRGRPSFISSALSGRIARFFGDTSYSGYLLHMLLVIPIGYALVQQSWFTALSNSSKLITALLAVGLPLYAISYLLHRSVEMKGIELGRLVAKRVRPISS